MEITELRNNNPLKAKYNDFSAGLFTNRMLVLRISHPDETCSDVWDNTSLSTVLFKTDSCKDSVALKTDLP